MVLRVRRLPPRLPRPCRTLSPGRVQLDRHRGARAGARGRELSHHPREARRADAVLRAAAALARAARAAARGAAQVKIEAMVRWMASAAARGSGAERIGRPTTM